MPYTWMKRWTIRKGASRTRLTAVKKWTECWLEALDMNRIRVWIERISRHIQKVIRLNEGNEYKKDRHVDFDERSIYKQSDRKARCGEKINPAQRRCKKQIYKHFSAKKSLNNE